MDVNLGICLFEPFIIGVFLISQALKDIHIKDPEDEKSRRNADMLRKIFWFVGVSRNAVVVVVAALIAFFVHKNNNEPLILTGKPDFTSIFKKMEKS